MIELHGFKLRGLYPVSGGAMSVFGVAAVIVAIVSIYYFYISRHVGSLVAYVALRRGNISLSRLFKLVRYVYPTQGLRCFDVEDMFAKWSMRVCMPHFELYLNDVRLKVYRAKYIDDIGHSWCRSEKCRRLASFIESYTMQAPARLKELKVLAHALFDIQPWIELAWPGPPSAPGKAVMKVVLPGLGTGYAVFLVDDVIVEGAQDIELYYL